MPFQKGNKEYLKRTLSKEARRSIGEKNSKHLRGRKLSQATKDKISKKLKGIKRPKANEKQLKVLSEGRKKALESLRRNHPDFSGEKNPFYGKHHTKETWNKIRQPKGWHHTNEAKRKISTSEQGEKHWNWKGGVSKIEYGQGWTNALKESIRLRDNYRCQICGISQTECLESLIVHHKDNVKTNLNPDNLISLCRSCHSKLHNSKKFRKKVKPLCLN
ncbi:MAG: HNH endonuclease [Candidatus Freyarchaeota archaeon]